MPLRENLIHTPVSPEGEADRGMYFIWDFSN